MIDDPLLTPLTPEEEAESRPSPTPPRPTPQPLTLLIPRGERGNGSAKCWAAQLTGQFGFSREFLDRTWARDGWEFMAQPGTIVETAWPNGERKYHYIGSHSISQIDRDEAKTMLRCAKESEGRSTA